MFPGRFVPVLQLLHHRSVLMSVSSNWSEQLDTEKVCGVSPAQLLAHSSARKEWMRLRIQSKLSTMHACRSQPWNSSFWKDFTFGFDMIDFTKQNYGKKDTHLAIGRLLILGTTYLSKRKLSVGSEGCTTYRSLWHGLSIASCGKIASPGSAVSSTDDVEQIQK